MKKYFLLICFFLAVIGLNAEVCTTKTTGGNWFETSTWINGRIPYPTEDVVIQGNVFADKVFTCGKVTIEKNSNLKITNTGNVWSIINGTLKVFGCFEVTENSQLKIFDGIDNVNKAANCIHNNGIIEVGTCK